MTDLSAVPLVALSNKTKETISTLLNPTKCIPSDDGLPRDWRGLADLSGLGGEAIPNISSKPDPCGYILNIMQEKSRGLTLGEFQNFLEKLNRWDIIDDTIALMVKDAESYKERSDKMLTSADVIENDIDAQILTYDDSYRLQEGLGKQYYDAFLLFDDADINFADEVTDNLEQKFGLKLCRKDRDFIVGLPFEHSATMQLISERCNRLLVIVSPDFLKSPANKFFLNFAQALGIDKGQRKIIPCVHKACQLPPELSYYYILDYHRAGKFSNFWNRLRDSVKTPGNASGAARSIVASPAPEQEQRQECKNELARKNKTCDDVEKLCEAKRESHKSPCKEKVTTHRPCKAEETRCHPCEPRPRCPVENVENVENEKFECHDKKDKKTTWPFRGNKFTFMKQKRKEKRTEVALETCESLPVLNSEPYVSTLSLPDTEKRKKNFVHKYVSKVRGLMKS